VFALQIAWFGFYRLQYLTPQHYSIFFINVCSAPSDGSGIFVLSFLYRYKEILF